MTGHFKFNAQAHVKSLVTRALPRINILKALIGTNWGQQKEIILITYKSLIGDKYFSPSLIQKLQTIQNSALCIATGYVKMASIDHLHEETEMLPVQNHFSIICSQYLTRALHPSNPSHSVVTFPSGSRDMKQTIQSRFQHYIAPHLSSGILPPPIMGPPSSPCILELLPFLSLFYLITASFRLLPRKLIRKKQTLQKYPFTSSVFFL